MIETGGGDMRDRKESEATEGVQKRSRRVGKEDPGVQCRASIQFHIKEMERNAEDSLSIRKYFRAVCQIMSSEAKQSVQAFGRKVRR